MIKIMTGNERILKEYEKRKVSTLRKHEAEMEALKVRQKRELEGLHRVQLPIGEVCLYSATVVKAN